MRAFQLHAAVYLLLEGIKNTAYALKHAVFLS
jgi:hypothetical protein